MNTEPADNTPLELALGTKLEDDFVSPTTAIRGALEILRDFSDLDDAERATFVNTALTECARLERGISELADAVYQAGRGAKTGQAKTPAEVDEAFASRIRFDKGADVVDVDFSEYRFCNSADVNAFYDAIETMVEATERDWYFIVNHRRCSVWPEAWVAFAHRGKRIRVNHAKGIVRYTDEPGATIDPNGGDDAIRPSREAALEDVAAMRAERR